MSEKKPSAGEGPAKTPGKPAAGPAKQPAPPPLVEFIMAPTDSPSARQTRIPGVGLVDFTLGPVPVRSLRQAKKGDALQLNKEAKPHPGGSIAMDPAKLAGMISNGSLRVARPTTSTSVTPFNPVSAGQGPAKAPGPVVRAYMHPVAKVAKGEKKPEPKVVHFEILPLRALSGRTP